jgi:glycosyltransferase involved in cell wall biosynthesis
LSFGKVAICNDLVTGSMGERVLWDFLLEAIPGSVGVDQRLVGSSGNFAAKARHYLDKYHPDTRMIIQNATFIDYIDTTRLTIAFLQDNLRAMGRTSEQQESNLRRANLCVANSIQTAASYPDYTFEIIPVGIDTDLFQPLPRQAVRTELGFGDGPVGIFVGCFSEVKGWSQLVDCIRQFPEITWILVSKYEETFTAPNARVYNQVPQPFLIKLLNCANFFIIGSPVETECLAALEACLCDIPVVMRNVGIFQDFSVAERRQLGIFGPDFGANIPAVLQGSFTPRRVILERHLSVKDSMAQWLQLLNRLN